MKIRKILKLKKQSNEPTVTISPVNGDEMENTNPLPHDIGEDSLKSDANVALLLPSTSQISLTEAEPIFRYAPLTLNWSFQQEAVAGIKHRNMQPPLPCQDSSESGIIPRPFVIVADGAGSSPMSDIGSQAVVTALARLLKTLEMEVDKLLNQVQEAPDAARRFSLILVKHAMGVLIDLAQIHRRAVKDFRCTLLLAIVGEINILWLKVGDGEIVAEKMRVYPDHRRESEWCTLGAPGKGDFANETVFVDERLQPSEVQSGLLPAAYICALGAMSDGSALALVSNDGQRVSSRLSAWTKDLREGNLKKSLLTASFYDVDFSRRAMGDDCSIALVSCSFDQRDLAS